MNIDTFTRLNEGDMNHVFKIIEQLLGGMG